MTRDAIRPATPAWDRVRTAGPDDVDALAGLLGAALADKYRAAFGVRAEAAIAALARAELAAGIAGYVVATRDDQVVGAAHVSVSDEAALMDWSAALRPVLGRPRTLWAGLVLSVLAHGPLSGDEAYVGEVAVHPGARRQGVAAALLAEIERRALARGRTVLSLWVTFENDAAVALYVREGFEPVTTRYWPLGRRLFRARGATLMHKRLGVTSGGTQGKDSLPPRRS